MLVAASAAAADVATSGDDVIVTASSTRARVAARLFCPPVMVSGATFRIPVTLRNLGPEPVTATRGALLTHVGAWKVRGPAAVSVSASMQPSGVGDAVADSAVTIAMPHFSRAGTMVFVALSFFGHVGSKTTRELLGTATCGIEGAAAGSRVLASIDVSPTSATVAAGTVQRFVAGGRFSDGTTESPLAGVTWSSDATGVATVDATGSAVAIAAGRARIRASRDGVAAMPALLTVPPSVIGLVITLPAPALSAGETRQLTATEMLSDGTSRDTTGLVQWQSNAQAVAIVDATGLMRGVGPGAATITATHPGGLTASTSVTVRALISVSVAPVPLAIPPDGSAQTFAIQLSQADVVAHTVTLSVADTTIASVSPATVTFVAGQTSAQASITGLIGGQTILTIASTTVAGTSVPVLVTTEFRAINTVTAPLLGLVLQFAPPQPTLAIGPIQSTVLGVVLGGAIRGLSPSAVVIGTGPTPVVISGAGLQGVTSVTVVPSTGVTLGALTIGADGTSVAVPITVAPDAAPGVRQLVVMASGQRIMPATPGADRLLVALPTPVIDSIDPLFATPGTPDLTLTVRGWHLAGAQAVAFSPAPDIAVATPVVSAGGTQLTVRIAVSSLASPGPRVVTVASPGGTSDATPSSANTFTIVHEIGDTRTPIEAPIVGVVKQATTTPAQQTVPVFSPVVGVAHGSVVTALAPAAGSIGTTTTLTVQGHGLQGVTAIQLVPGTGLTVGAATVAADGVSASVPVTIAADAPLSARTVQVLAGTTPVVFASPAASLFFVTAPSPELDSVTPIILQTGTTETLTFRGVNLRGTSRVDVTPSAGVAVDVPAVSDDGTMVTVAIVIGSTAAPGPRVVTLTTPAGTTPSAPSPSNTVTLASALGATFSPVLAAPLGVVRQETTSTSTVTLGPIASPSLGVTLLALPPPPQAISSMLGAPALGVAVGSVATSSDPLAVAPGSTGTFTIHGSGLTPVSGVALSPPGGVLLGLPEVSPDGTTLQVSFVVDAGQPHSVRTLALLTATGTVPFAPAHAALVYLNAVPSVNSIAPIVVCRDTPRLPLVVRGLNFEPAIGVTVTPADGIAAGTTIAVAIVGQQGLETDEAYVDLAIAPDAPLGERVVRLLVPGFATTDQAIPANTLTVIERPRPDTGGMCPGIPGG